MLLEDIFPKAPFTSLSQINWQTGSARNFANKNRRQNPKKVLTTSGQVHSENKILDPDGTSFYPKLHQEVFSKVVENQIFEISADSALRY